MSSAIEADRECGAARDTAPDRRHGSRRPRRCAATRGRPARSSSTVHAPARAARVADELDDRARPGRRRSRAGRRRRAPARRAAASSSRPITRQPVGAAVERDGRLEATPRSGSAGDASARTYGRFASTRSNGSGDDRRQQVGLGEATVVGDARARPRSRAPGPAPPPRCRSRGPRPRRRRAAPRSATARATAIAPLPVPTSATRSGGAPAGRARGGEPAHDLGRRPARPAARSRAAGSAPARRP